MQIAMPKLVLLDVYETMLDMGEVKKQVNNLMGSKRGYILWRELLLQYCFMDNCMAQFNNFMSIAKAAMQMTADTFDKDVTEDSINRTLEILKHLPIHQGVQEGLSKLNDMDMRIAALTNAPEQLIRNRMEFTGLISYFEKVLSAELIGKYKPSLDVYLWAAANLELPPEEILLVSAHGWDLAGATHAGMMTAYLKQNKQMLNPLTPKPMMTCVSLLDLANQLTQVVYSPELGGQQ
jgi:2-haloacid dehalogenase